MAGGNSHQRAVQRAAEERINKQVSETVAQYLKENKVQSVQPKETPWYEGGLFWGCISLAAAIVLTVIAAMQRDLRRLLFLAWPLAGIAYWVACKKLQSQSRRWALFFVLLVATGIGLWRLRVILDPKLVTMSPETTSSRTKDTGASTAPISPPQDLSQVEKALEEIKKNTSQDHIQTGRPAISGVQMEAIRELDQFIVGRDEMALRQAFGFPSMMEKNIQLNIAIVSHFKKGTPLDVRPYFIGTETIMDSALAEGHIRRYGGGFVRDPPDAERVYMLILPSEYSSGKKQLLKFETSSELPTSVIKEVKDFDDSVYKNADKLLHVLNDALKKDPDYYLRYNDSSSSKYFHQIDAMWLDNFIQLRPKADKIRDAVRQFLGVK